MLRFLNDHVRTIHTRLRSRIKKTMYCCRSFRGRILGLTLMTERLNAWILICVAAAVVATWIVFSGILAAQTLDQDELKQEGLSPRTHGDWNVTLGVGAGIEPKYLGAKDFRVSPIPLIAIKYRGLFFISPQGIGINAFKWEGLRAGPILSYKLGRDESADDHLKGLGDIDRSVLAGGFISYAKGPFTVNATIRQALSHTENGLTGRLALDYRRPIIAKKLFLVAGPALNFSNGEYARTWFGVTPDQSAASGLPVYTPDGGLRDVGLKASLTYRWTEHILLRSFVDVRELVGDVSDSPVVQTKTQALIGFGAAYHF